MERSGDNRTVPAEHSSPPPPNSSGRRPHRHERQRSRKKRKVISSETETRIQIQTLRPSSYTHRRTNSYVQKQGNSRKKPRKPQCQRKWTYSTHDVSNYNDRFVIVSYNILGVENATKHPELYRGVSPKYLDWGHRKKLLCKEVKDYQASILCFQEVDHFNDLKEILGSDGFRGLHKARSGETRDGCAIFWKTEQFTLLHEESIEFQRFGLRNNVAQFCVLKMNQDLPSTGVTARPPCPSTSRNFLVGNIHVLYNPKRGDIKLGQMRIFLEKAYELSQEWGCIPVVITGDLNSLPQSAMYQFLASSKLHIQQYDRRHVSGQIFPSEYAESQSRRNRITRPLMNRWTNEEIMLATGSRLSVLRHHLKLCSAYAGVPGTPEVRDKIGEPLTTSYHCLFTGTVDYIWHTSDLVPVRVLETLPICSLKKTGGLPCKKWGSDHLAVACELAFADEGD
ncbi:carbon catabolite repressor protein 4 homolog 5 isoform X1 [Sesamum indicum]|uniref:Carbon catabolite repressor protein 4 homolog 5 isoform X1 n=2 Tax=Sesamum indicum TaxID=4182 RepID=A0A6I9SU79_SESIN|nr:carbon catabolite repressor protein 4 homolog 5 isoform X1 [Sesamum indicum]